MSGPMPNPLMAMLDEDAFAEIARMEVRLELQQKEVEMRLASAKEEAALEMAVALGEIDRLRRIEIAAKIVIAPEMRQFFQMTDARAAVAFGMLERSLL